MMSSTQKIMTKLLEAGADPNIQDKRGDTMIMDRVYSDLLNIENIELLNKYGIDFDIKIKRIKFLRFIDVQYKNMVSVIPVVRI